MKKIITIATAASLLMVSCGKNNKQMSSGFEAIVTKSDSISYFLGNDMGNGLRTNNIHRKFVPASFHKGFQDGSEEGTELLLSQEDGNGLIMKNLTILRSDTSAFTFKTSSIEGFKSLSTMSDSISYFLGSDVASLFRNGFKEYYNQAAFYKGMEDGLTETEAIVSKEAGEKLARAVMAEQQQAQMEAEKASYAESIAANEAYLIEKSGEEDVVTLPSGLRYKVINAGSGAKPLATDTVKVHYHGTLIDGTVFDSSVERGEPISFPLNQVIPGWTEGVQLMSIGSKYEFYIPQELAYGAQGGGGKIPPYSTLIFQVELLEIN